MSDHAIAPDGTAAALARVVDLVDGWAADLHDDSELRVADVVHDLRRAIAGDRPSDRDEVPAALGLGPGEWTTVRGVRRWVPGPAVKAAPKPRTTTRQSTHICACGATTHHPQSPYCTTCATEARRATWRRKAQRRRDAQKAGQR